MDETLVLWTHGSQIPYAGIYVVDVKRTVDFENIINALKDPEARKKYNRIIVSSFNEMQLSFGLKTTGKLLQKLYELEVKYNYTINYCKQSFQTVLCMLINIYKLRILNLGQMNIKIKKSNEIIFINPCRRIFLLWK